MPEDAIGPPFNSQWVGGNLQPMKDPYEEAARRRAAAVEPPFDSLTPDDGEAYYRSALQWLRHTATIHYIGDAFDPEHMRELANFATAALRGDPITDYDDATERGRHEARRLMELFSDAE